MKTSNKFVVTGIFLSMTLVLALVVPVIAQAQYYLGLCTPHSYQQCNGNYLYWYDSCGNQQEISQYCQNGCYNNSCYNNYNNNYGNCTYHAYKLCVGSSIYWYSGCDQQQDLYYTCPVGQTCNNPGQYGTCSAPYVQPVPSPYPPYVVQYRTACYGNSLYWYDSLGVSTGLYKNCTDNDPCTIDSCSAGKCQNVPDTSCQPTPTPTPAPTPTPSIGSLSISFFAKQDLASGQWQKTVQAGSDGTVYFLIPVVNSSSNQVDNINVSVNIPTEISYLGNLQVNNVPVSGDIVSGINIGSLSATSTKSITFEGKTQTIQAASTKQAVVKSNIQGSEKTDTISINFVTEKATASVSSSVEFSVSGFLKRWYMWLLAGLVLAILVVVVFRRFSSPS